MNNTEESFMMVGKDLQVLIYNAVANKKINQFYNISLKKGLRFFRWMLPRITMNF